MGAGWTWRQCTKGKSHKSGEVSNNLPTKPPPTKTNFNKKAKRGRIAKRIIPKNGKKTLDLNQSSNEALDTKAIFRFLKHFSSKIVDKKLFVFTGCQIFQGSPAVLTAVVRIHEYFGTFMKFYRTSRCSNNKPTSKAAKLYD